MSKGARGFPAPVEISLSPMEGGAKKYAAGDDLKADLLKDDRLGGAAVPGARMEDPTAQPVERAVPYSELFRFADGTDRALMAVALVCAGADGVTFPSFSFLFAGLLDAFMDQDALVAKVETYSLYLLAIAVGSFIAGTLRTACSLISAERQGVRLRKAYLHAVLRQDQGWHDTHRTGEVTSRMSEDVLVVLDAIGEKMATFVTTVGTFTMSLALGFSRGPDLAGVVCAFVPVIGILGGVFAVGLTSWQKKEQDAYAAAGAAASEALGSMRTVAACCGEGSEVARYQRYMKAAEATGIKKGFAMGATIGAIFAVLQLAYGVALWYGSQRILKSRADQPECRYNPTQEGCYTGGTVVNCFFSVIMAAFAMAGAAPFLGTVASAKAAAARIFETIDRQPSIDATSTAGSKPPPGSVVGRIEFRGVTFAYPSRPDEPVLKNFSIVFEPGTHVALVGGSGSGKSTIIALLQRLYDPQSGTVLLDGLDLREYNVSWLRTQLGLVSQEPTLFSCSIKQNIAYGLAAEQVAAWEEADLPQGRTGGGGPRVRPLAVDDGAVRAAASAANAHTFISKLRDGYDTLVGEKGSQMSGGQKQRIAIARAIIRNPRILLLDEATSALDTASERIVQAALDKLLSSSSSGGGGATGLGGSGGGRKRTCIVIAHRLSTITGCDRILVLREGLLVEDGNHAALMARPNGVYRGLREMQSGGGGAPSAASSSSTAVVHHASSLHGSSATASSASSSVEGALRASTAHGYWSPPGAGPAAAAEGPLRKLSTTFASGASSTLRLTAGLGPSTAGFPLGWSAAAASAAPMAVGASGGTAAQQQGRRAPGTGSRTHSGERFMSFGEQDAGDTGLAVVPAFGLLAGASSAAGSSSSSSSAAAVAHPATIPEETQTEDEDEADTARLLLRGEKASPSFSSAPAPATTSPLSPPVSNWRVWSYNKPEWAIIVVAILAAGANGAVQPVFSILFSRMVAVFYNIDDDVVRSKTLFYMAMFGVIGAGAFLANFLQIGLFVYSGEKLTGRLRVATYSALMRQEIGFFDAPENATGRLTTRLATDATLVKAMTGDRLGRVVQAAASLLAGVSIAFSASWQLSLISMALLPLIAGVQILQMKAVAALTDTTETQEAGQVAAEAVSGIRTVAALGLAPFLQAQFDAALEGELRLSRRRAMAAGVGTGANSFVIFGSYAGVFYAGARLIKLGVVDFQGMLQTFFAIVMAAQGVGMASSFSIDAGKADTATRTIFGLLDRVSAIDPCPAWAETGPSALQGAAAQGTTLTRSGTVAPVGSSAQRWEATQAAEEAEEGAQSRALTVTGRIEFKGVVFAYPIRPDTPVLRGVDLVIEPGTTVALVGPSGSGKSSIIALVERFYDPVQGAVLLDGVDLRTLLPHALRNTMALVQQEPALWGESIAYNIEYGRVGRKPQPGCGVAVDAGDDASTPAGFVLRADVQAAAADANAATFVTAFKHGYATAAGDRGSQLSGGQKQRIAIARAIMRNPRILLLDEATSALDSASERIVQAALDRLIGAPEGGAAPSAGRPTPGSSKRTTIVIAHRLSTIRHADKIVVIQDGLVVEQGTHDALMGVPEGVYRGLAMSQEAGGGH